MNTVEILQELGVDYREAGQHKNVRHGWVGLECPTCDQGKSGGFKLGVPIGGFAASCWTCGRMPLLDALVELSGQPRHIVKALLGGLDPVPRAERPPGKLQLPRGLGPLQPVHRRYLRSRGFDPDVLARLWGVQGIGLDGGRFAWRLFLPVVWRGETVSWTTRALAETQGARYVTADPSQEALPARSVLFGGDLARHAAVIVEGPFDAIALGPGAVATLGVSVTDAQVRLLGEFPSRCILFDAEPAALRRAEALAARLEALPGRTCVWELSTGNDPASCSVRERRAIRKKFLE